MCPRRSGLGLESALFGSAVLITMSCNNDAGLQTSGTERGPSGADDTRDTGRHDSDSRADSGDEFGEAEAFRPAGDPPPGWSDFECQVPDDRYPVVYVGYLDSSFFAGSCIGRACGLNGFRLYPIGQVCVGAAACAAGHYDATWQMDAWMEGLTNDERAPGARWQGAYGPQSQETPYDGKPLQIDVYLTFANGLSFSSSVHDDYASDAEATLCLARVMPTQISGIVYMAISGADAAKAELPVSGTGPLTLALPFDISFEQYDIQYYLGVTDLQAHQASWEEFRQLSPCKDPRGPWGRNLVYNGAYELSWPWDQITDPVIRQQVYDSGRPCNWVP